MNKTALMLLATVLLLTGTVHPDPVQAGTVTVVNKTNSFYCKAKVIAYFLGAPSDFETPCAAPGKTEWRNSWLSTGYITAVCYQTKDCQYRNRGDGGPSDTFRVSGTWLPHRNITVTVTNMNFSNPDLPPWGTFAFEEK